MESSPSFSNLSPFTTLQPPPRRPKPKPYSFQPNKSPLSLSPPKALKSPKGFGPKSKNQTKRRKPSPDQEDEDEDDGGSGLEGGEKEDVVIPEIVTNRMMKRMGLSVGIPLSIGLLFFPFFYYLKVVAKVDVPNWIPFLVSFAFFGAALLGVSYGIVSASWDPMREGSLLGWNEARRNWPVFWDSLWGGGGGGKKR